MAPIYRKNHRYRNSVINQNAYINSSKKSFSVGEFIWAKLPGCKWWPAIVIDSSDCGRSPAKYGHTWIFWFGDYKISEMSIQKILHFTSCFYDMCKVPSSKLRLKAITEALQILASMANHPFDSTDDLFKWANDGFQNFELKENASLPQLVTKHLNCVKNDEMDGDQSSEHSDSESDIEPFFEKLQSGILKIEEICISCHGGNTDIVSDHPFFIGGLCSSCKDRLKETAFALGDDAKSICCIICSEPGFIIVCENMNCSRSYCHKCMKCYLGTETAKQIVEISPWYCFFCSENDVNNILKIRNDWEQKLLSLFTTEKSAIDEVALSEFLNKQPLTVLSLFDGISTGKLVLDMLGIVINKYYSSEIDEDAINVAKFHYKDSVIFLGDVRNITDDKIESLGRIDLVLGGSPCNDLSLVNPARKGLYDFNGTGCLFFDFFHILNVVKRKNKNVFYLFENVAAMTRRDKIIISSFLLHEPALIDAKYFSPQTRARYFWGNIPGLHSLPKFWNSLPSDAICGNLLNEYILPNMGREAVVEKIKTVTTQRNSLIQDNCTLLPVVMNGEPDVLWVTELEKIFGFPLHYTDIGNLGITKRRELLGRSWSVPVVKTILRPLKNFFECK